MKRNHVFTYSVGAIALTLLFLILAVLADAAPLPPMPKRPLQSPRAASVQKATPMFKPAATEPLAPRLPMTAQVVHVDSPYGNWELTARALQPANQSLLFQVAPVLYPNAWDDLAWLGAQPEDQWSFATLYSRSETLFIRARVSPVPPDGFVPVSGTNMQVNPAWKGARVWRVKK